MDKKNLIDSDDNMYLAIDLLIGLDNIKIILNNIALNHVDMMKCI